MVAASRLLVAWGMEGARAGLRETFWGTRNLRSLLAVPWLHEGRRIAKLIKPYVSNVQFVACQLNLNKAVKERNVLGGGICQVHSRGLICASMFKRR